jgi:hypothetical protein
VPETTSHQRQKNSSAVTSALLLLLAATALVLPHVTASLVAEEWANRVNALVFIFVGVMLLHVVGRVR